MEEIGGSQFLQLPKMKKASRLAVALLITTLIGFGASGYLFYKYQIEGTKYDPLHHTKNVASQKAAQEEVKKVVDEVGKLIELPKGEDPTLGTITDVNRLKDQVFFKNAKNGDKLLIYTNAKKVVLYDPVSKHIIDVAPLVIGNSSNQAPQAKIGLRNGTSTSGLAAKVETDIKKAFPDANIVNRDNASAQTYDKTLVIALNDNAKDPAAKLATAIGASVTSLPSGEGNLAGIDILVILGKDKI